jgi:hypothetical protein
MHRLHRIFRDDAGLPHGSVDLCEAARRKSSWTSEAACTAKQPVRITMRTSNYLGTSFAIWNGRHTWFWFVADPSRSGAAIGAAANKAEAIGEAHRSIEEMTARRLRSTESLEISKAIVRTVWRCSRAGSADPGWHHLLVRLDRYLARLCSEYV